MAGCGCGSCDCGSLSEVSLEESKQALKTRVWVQVWTAPLPGAVQVEESDLVAIRGLESVKAMVPMVVRLEESLVKVEERVEVLESTDLKALAHESLEQREKRRQWEIENCWRWVNHQEKSPQKNL